MEEKKLKKIGCELKTEVEKIYLSDNTCFETLFTITQLFKSQQRK